MAQNFFDLSGLVLGLIGAVPVFTGMFFWVLHRKNRKFDDLHSEFEELANRYERYRDARQKQLQENAEALEQAKIDRDRLSQIDPECFIDQVTTLYDAGKFEEAEKVALDFSMRQSEAFGLAAEILAEQRLLDSETEGQWAADDAVKFAAIGRAANPESKRLAELENLAHTRIEGIQKGEPIEALAMDGMSDVELNGLSHQLIRSGQYALAEVAARRSVPLALARTGELSENYAAVIGHHARTLSNLGEFAAAEKLFREALAIDAKTIGAAHPDYATHLNSLACVLGHLGQFDAAEKHCRQAIKIWEARLGAEHPHTISGRENLEILLANSKR